jgi:hypothetical protein
MMYIHTTLPPLFRQFSPTLQENQDEHVTFRCASTMGLAWGAEQLPTQTSQRVPIGTCWQLLMIWNPLGEYMVPLGVYGRYM